MCVCVSVCVCYLGKVYTSGGPLSALTCCVNADKLNIAIYIAGSILRKL